MTPIDLTHEEWDAICYARELADNNDATDPATVLTLLEIIHRLRNERP